MQTTPLLSTDNVNFSKNCDKFELRVKTLFFIIIFKPKSLAPGPRPLQATTLIDLATTMTNITQNIDWSSPAFYFQTGNQLMFHYP